MRCPFLREAQVKFCCASEFKKLIVRGQMKNSAAGEYASEERCSSPAYATCPSAKQRFEDVPSRDHCPFLQESLCQYCAAASVVKYVPYSDPSLTRCGTSGHRYCELLMTMQNPQLLTPHDVVAPEIDRDDDNESGYWTIDGVQTVGWLLYSQNHMWADIGDDGIFHVGLDAFFARVIGEVEKLTFASTNGGYNPAVSVTVNGVDLHMIFPMKLAVSSTNSHLRVDPNRVITDPYTLGWLFEGRVTDSPARGFEKDRPPESLIHGRKAKDWMREETRRMTEFISSAVSRENISTHGSPMMMADGGMFTAKAAAGLSREDVLELYNEFFSPRPGGIHET